MMRWVEEPHISRTVWIVAVVGVTAAVFFVLFSQLGTAPSRSTADEAYYLRAAAERLRGQEAPFSLARITSVSPLYPFPPLFRWLLAGVLGLTGVSLAGGRAFFAFVAVVLLTLIAFLSFRVAGKRAAVWSVVGLMTLPVFWEYVRLVMPHSLVAVFTLASVVCLNEWHRSRRDRWLAGAIALATVSVFQHYWALYYALLLPFLARPWSHRRTWFTLLPFVSLGLFWLERYLRFGTHFVRDFQEFFRWESSGGFLGPQTLFQHLSHPFAALADALIRQPFLLLGLIGVLCIRDRWQRNVLFAYTLVTALFVFRDRDFFQYPHLSVLVVPGFAIGYGVVLHRLLTRWLPWLTHRIGLMRVRSFFLVGAQGVLVVVFLSLTIPTIAPVVSRWQSAPWQAASRRYQGEVDSIVRHVQENYSSDQLVIAASDLTWRIPNRTADFAWAYLRQHQYLPGELTPFHDLAWSTTDSDYAYSTALPDASLVIFERKQLAAVDGAIVDPFVPVYRDLLSQMDDWPVLAETEHYVLFQNPKRGSR